MILLQKSILGIDIGSFNIKVVECQQNNGKMEIVNYAITRTPDNSVVDGKITNEEKIVGAIKELLSKNFIKTKKAVGLISSSAVVTREVNIPKMKEAEIDKYIQIDSQQYFPMDLSEYILDYKILEETAGVEGPEYVILLTAVPEVLVTNYIKVIESLKLELEAIDIIPNVISKYVTNYLTNKADKMGNTIAVIDLGAQSTNISIISNGILQFNRMIPNGSNEITQAIGSTFKLSYEEAEEYKLKNAEIVLESYNKENLSSSISEVCKPVLDNIASYINKFFEFYSTRSKNNKINSIYLVGGGSLLKGIDEYYRAIFNIPTRKIHPADGIVEKSNKPTAQKDLAITLNAFASTYRES